ncbi:transglycosylase SLT domain-containing protein [Serratia sp. BIGb0163]|uniref:transglycosylase SLT domain-containing protein n=1 Tax=Serratia sp. BIGb0163 TaxID=2940613 RepID=UPI00216828C8|nr:transglycosylase SLT domain-containing protein [Serratia sp. BIGb0163]MCS4265026.1 hypothetical protein [Serratia sp. BIGb0163]
MAGNQLPVLTLDIDEEKIRQLQEITEKFKAAFGAGPGGFTVNAPPPQKTIPGANDSPPSQQKGTLPAQRQRDDNGRFITSGGVKPTTPKPKGVEESGFEKFLKRLNKNAQGTLKTFGLINRTLGTTTTKLKGLFSTTLSWGTKLLALSVAGPFGYGLMARQATGQYRDSQGLGVTTGQLQAAKNVYGTRISGTDSIMQTLAEVQNDPKNPAYKGLMALGVNPTDGVNANLPKLLTKLDELSKQYKGTGAVQTVLSNMGLGFVGTETMNQIKANSGYLPLLNQQYAERSQHLDSGIGGGTQEALQRAYSNLSYNADRIGNTFLTALGKLSPSITKFSDSITSGLEKFIRGENGKALFETVARGLEKLATWLGSDQFQKDLTEFGRAVKAIVLALRDAVLWITGNVNLSGAGTGKDKADSSLVNFGDKYLDGQLPGANPLTNKYTGIFSEDAAHSKYQMPSGLKGNVQDFVEQMNDKAQLPRGLMSAIAETESSWNPLAKGPMLKDGTFAAGLFQFIPQTAKAYGLTEGERYDPNKSTFAAARYLQDNMRRYKGDIAKTLTQYNGGKIDNDGNLSLRKETVKYLMKILPQVQGGLEQHPGIIGQLSAARDQLARSPDDARATIKLDINQMPGSDISAQVRGVYIPPR